MQFNSSEPSFFPDKSTCSSFPGVSGVLRNSIFCLASVFSPKLNSESWAKDTFSDKWFVNRYATKNQDDTLKPLLSIIISFVGDQQVKNLFPVRKEIVQRRQLPQQEHNVLLNLTCSTRKIARVKNRG